MKTFVVIEAVTRASHFDGHVMAFTKSERLVEADYYRVVDGVLTFRNSPRRNEQYPETVRVFAPGFWAEVYEKISLADRVAETRARAAGEREIDIPPSDQTLPHVREWLDREMCA